MRLSFSNRRHRTLVLVGLLIAALAATLAVELSSQVRREFASSLMAKASSHTELELRKKIALTFAPLENQLQITGKWGELGAVNLEDPKTLNLIFMPILEQFPHLASVLIANEEGQEYMVMREGNHWRTRTTDAKKHPGKVHWQGWTRPDQSKKKDWSDLNYDPRTRPWFQAAQKEASTNPEGIAITKPYRFFTTGQYGITLSRLWREQKNQKVAHVVGFDVLLDHVLNLVGDLSLARDGVAFLLNQNQEVLAWENSANGESGTKLTRVAREIENKALKTWKKAGSPLNEALPFQWGGRTWWLDLRPATDDPQGPNLALLVPQKAFLTEVRHRQHLLALLVGGLMMLGGLGAYVLLRIAQRSTIPERSGPDLTSEEGLKHILVQGESDHLEFKNTLRWNLNKDKAGKEVEISWLKTVGAYLNTAGGILLIGVTDEGEVSGIEADQFSSEDKFLLHFNNLIKQHIGLEFSSLIKAHLQEVGDKKVFVVECLKAENPVYVKLGQDERFYVRVGPSSRQLSMSDVVKRFRQTSA